MKVENPASASSKTDVIYRRTIDWNIEPGPEEIITIQGVGPLPARLLQFSDDGTTFPSPTFPLSSSGCAAPSTYFVDCAAPGDHGAAFDVQMGPIAPGATFEFCMYYGAGTDEADAMATIADLGIEFYSLAKSTSAGTPVTFFVAIGCLTPPVAEIDLLPGVVCADTLYSAGIPARFKDLSHASDVFSSPPEQSTWDFGDGNSSTTNWDDEVDHMYADPGTYPVTLNVVDQHGMTASATMNIIVLDCSPPNLAPSFLDVPCQDVLVGRTLRFDVRASDPDGSPKHPDYYRLDLTATALPLGATFEAVQGAGSVMRIFQWTPEAHGEYKAVFHVTDNHLLDPLTDTLTVCIRVEPLPLKQPAPDNSDADGDGVPDGHDPCPATAGASGCPAKDAHEEDTVADASGPDDGPDDGCRIDDLLPTDVDGRLVDEEVAVSWRPPTACHVDRFLVWNGTQGDLIASVPFDPGLDAYEVVDADPWPEPHRYYVQAEAVPGPDVFVYPRAVATGIVALESCKDCDALVSEPRGKDVPPIQGFPAFLVGGPSLLFPWLPVLLVLLAAWWFWHSYGALVRFFSRLDENKVLDHPVRAQLHGLVVDEPGIYVRELVRRSGRNRSVVRHHLRMLVDAGALREHGGDGHRRYFPGAGEPADAGPVHRALAQRVLTSVRDSPGRNVSQIAAGLGVTRKAVRYHLKRFQDEGILHIEHTRRGTVVRLAAERGPHATLHEGRRKGLY